MFVSSDFTFRNTTISEAFEKAGLLSAMKDAGLVKGPCLVREALIETERGVIHTQSTRNALGQIKAKAKAA